MEKRFYRKAQRPKGFKSFELTAGQSDVWIAVPKELFSEELKERLLNRLIETRAQIESYIRENPEFLTSLKPLSDLPPLVPKIVRLMNEGCSRCDVGPMAGVAGAVNLSLAEELKSSGVEHFIIENGGDVFLSREEPTRLMLLGVRERLGLEVGSGEWAVASSSSFIGHSLSLGRSSLATVVSREPVEADCCATYLGNSTGVEDALRRVEKIADKIGGAVVIIDGKLVAKGSAIKLVPIGREP